MFTHYAGFLYISSFALYWRARSAVLSYVPDATAAWYFSISARTLAADFCFLQEFRPHMVGLGPFIPQKDTPFAAEPAGTLEDTLLLLALVRLTLPRVLLPATTALGTIHPQGRELGILAGANVVMPNLSPPAVRGKYALYDNKLCTGDEAAEHLAGLKKRLKAIGCTVAVSRGDFPGERPAQGGRPRYIRRERFRSRNIHLAAHRKRGLRGFPC